MYARLTRADPVLAHLAAIHRHPDPFVFRDGGRTAGNNFAAMTLHILGQQIATPVAFVLYDRLAAATGGRPTPEAVIGLGAERIRQIGTSRAKAVYLENLARSVASGELDIERMSGLTDEDAILALTRIKGVGTWTAEIFLIYQLHRRDVLPAGDVGIRRAIKMAYGLAEVPPVSEVTQKGMTWPPYRTLASALLWMSLEAGRPTGRG
jgi:DNA-3-methyladenine glycosylase II